MKSIYIASCENSLFIFMIPAVIYFRDEITTFGLVAVKINSIML